MDTWLGSGLLEDDAIFAAAENLMGNVAGLRVCDLACRQGRVARYLADRNAVVTGIDISAKLLEIARRYEARQPRSIDYCFGDARTLDGFAASEFDDVVCFMSLMDRGTRPYTTQPAPRSSLGWMVRCAASVLKHPPL